MQERSHLLSTARLQLKRDSSESNSSDISLRLYRNRPLPRLTSVWKSPHTADLPTVISAPDVESTLSNSQFFMHIFRASVGPGMLALPSAVANAGLLFGMCGILIVSLFLLHCMHMLVSCTQFLRVRYGLWNSALDYGNTLRCCIMFGATWGKKLRWTTKLLDMCLLATQFGLSAVFLLFVAENIKLVVDFYAPRSTISLPVFLVITAVAVSPFAFIRSIAVLAKVSFFGNIFMAVAIIILLLYCFQDIPDLSNYRLIASASRIPLFFGVAIIAFESANVLLPTENALKDKESLLGWNGLMNLTMGLVLLLYLTVAFFGYVKFGDNVEGSLVYSIPLSPWYYMIVKPVYAIAVFLTFGTQFYVFIDVFWQTWTSLTPKSFEKIWINNAFRVVSLILVVITAAWVPYIEHVLSLIGSLSGSCICLIFPSFMHTVLFWNQSYNYQYFPLVIAKNTFLMLLGLFGGAIGTYSSILAIIGEAGQKFEPVTIAPAINMTSLK